MLLGVFGFLSFAGTYLCRYLSKLMTEYLSGCSSLPYLSEATAGTEVSKLGIYILLLSLPVPIVAAALGFAFDVAQTKFRITPKKLEFDFKKISFFSGLQRLVSLKSLVELAKSILKVIIVGYAVYSETISRITGFMKMSGADVRESASYLAQSVFYVGIKGAAVMTAIGVLDYIYQWWSYERQIMMTKQEIRDEYKETEGDPQIKGRLRNMRRKISMMRMMQQVPKADVVVKNPTHFAVAIKYEENKFQAPVVVAKGKDYLALKIIEVAEKNDVVVTENIPLARGLYAAVEVGNQIPAEYYQAVAEVLAFVYNLRKEKKSR